MLEFVIAAALLADPAPKQKVALTPPRTAVETPHKASTGTVLAGVAVTLECTARASGRVENCQVLGETHPGLGFGEAAIALMRDAEVAPGPADIQFARTFQFTP